MKRYTVLCSMLCLVPALLAFSPAGAGELKIEGGAPAIEKILKPISQPFQEATGIKLNMVASGPKAALTNLEAGTIDAAIGRGVDDWMKFMAKENTPVRDPAAFQMTVVGEDRVVMILNKDNPVSTLSGAQVKGIFTGKIDNWKQLGGPDAPVLVVLGKLIMPAVSIFYGKTLEGEPPLKDVMEVATASDVKAGVAANVEAIGIVSHKIADNSVKVPEGPAAPIVFTLATRANPSPEVAKLRDFITTDGKKYIK
jgi:phosphate transport system substrate-binding protein